MHKLTKDRISRVFTKEYKKEVLSASKNTNSFYSALKRDNQREFVHLIAEFKKKSPSKGNIRPDASIQAVISIYNDYASAVSVLTEPEYFGGDILDLKTASTLTSLPLLRKDFMIDPLQIYEARQSGASAVLLIAAFIDENQLQELYNAAQSLDMDALVEIHDLNDWEKIQSIQPDIIGINNRNLINLNIDLNQTHKIIKEISSYLTDSSIIISESGYKSNSDIEKIPSEVDALLIGSSIMESENIDETIERLGFLKR